MHTAYFLSCRYNHRHPVGNIAISLFCSTISPVFRSVGFPQRCRARKGDICTPPSPGGLQGTLFCLTYPCLGPSENGISRKEFKFLFYPTVTGFNCGSCNVLWTHWCKGMMHACSAIQAYNAGKCSDLTRTDNVFFARSFLWDFFFWYLNSPCLIP